MGRRVAHRARTVSPMRHLLRWLSRWARSLLPFGDVGRAMDQVHKADEKPLDQIRHAAIAIQTVRPNQQHIGVLHGVPSTHPQMLDLAWHHKLRNNPADGRYLWVDPDVPTARLKQVAALCRRVWRANGRGRIPYAFSPPNGSLDEVTGAILLGPSMHGLTCASFVLAVFGASGLHLVEYDTWPIGRPGDEQWQRGIVDLLKDQASQDHVEAITADIGTVRYRPEEVAAAAALPNPPNAFSVTESTAMQILELLSSS